MQSQIGKLFVFRFESCVGLGSQARKPGHNFRMRRLTGDLCLFLRCVEFPRFRNNFVSRLERRSRRLRGLGAHGKVIFGKKENRKEIANICMMHKDVYVAQTTCAHPNHFYKAIMEANQYPGPAIVNVFTTCQPEHGVADNMAEHQAKLAADSRSFPVFIYDPRKGQRFRERLSLVGNPNVKEDWYVNPKTGEQIDFVYWARTEGRFSNHFDKEGNPSPTLLSAQQDRLQHWHLFQDLPGIK